MTSQSPTHNNTPSNLTAANNTGGGVGALPSPLSQSHSSQSSSHAQSQSPGSGGGPQQYDWKLRKPMPRTPSGMASDLHARRHTASAGIGTLNQQRYNWQP